MQRVVEAMNHASLAREALRFRLRSVARAVDPDRFDLDGAAAFAVACGDPTVDAAIRRIGTAWLRCGLASERIAQPWTDDEAEHLLRYGGVDVIDALDEIVRTINTYGVFTSGLVGARPTAASRLAS